MKSPVRPSFTRYAAAFLFGAVALSGAIRGMDSTRSEEDLLSARVPLLYAGLGLVAIGCLKQRPARLAQCRVSEAEAAPPYQPRSQGNANDGRVA
jgi:hypothetical protein